MLNMRRVTGMAVGVLAGLGKLPCAIAAATREASGAGVEVGPAARPAIDEPDSGPGIGFGGTSTPAAMVAAATGESASATSMTRWPE